MATPSVLAFDAEGRAIDFEVWLDDLQLFLQCDRADGLSLFDLTSGAVPAPAADADATVRSQWATRDAAARLAVRRHLPTAERAHFSQGVLLPLSCPLSPLPLRPTSLVLSRSVRRLPLAGDAALARARGARERVGPAGAVEVEVEAAEGVGVAVEVVAGVGVLMAAVEAGVAAAVAVGAEVAEAAAVEAEAGAVEAEAGVAVVEVVGVELLSGAALGEVSASSSSSSVLATSPPLSSSCGGTHTAQRCFGRLTDAWLQQFPEAAEIPRWGELSRAGVAIFDLDFDAILAAMYAVTISDEGDCYRCFPPDPGIGTSALGASVSVLSGAGEAALSGTSASALSGTASASASHTFTLDSGASRSFFRDRTTLTPLSRPVAVSLADPSGGPVLSRFSTVLPCPAAPSGTLSGLYLPSFSTNLVSGADLQDAGVHQFTPARQRVTHCTEASTGRHLATFTRQPGSSLYTLTTASPPGAESGRVPSSGQVFAAASRSGPESAPCSCRRLSHETLLWHHRLGHPSLRRLRGMASRLLLSGLPRSLPPLPQGPGPACVPYVEGRHRAAPHSSQFPPTQAPLQTLHMDVWGPARVRGLGHERYFLLVVDDYSRYTTVFPLRSKGDVTEVLIDWIRAARLQLRQSFGSEFPVSRLHSDRGGEFSSGLLRAYCRTRRIRSTSTPGSPGRRPPQPCCGRGRLAMRRRSGSGDLGRLSATCLRTSCPLALQPASSWGSPPDAPGWQFYHPTSRRVLSSQDVTFDESVPYYRLFPYRTPSLPPPPLFLVPGPPPVDPLPPQGPAPSGVSQVDAVEPVEVTGDSGAAAGAEPGGAGSGGATLGSAEPGGAESGGAEPGGAEHGGAEPGGAEPGGAESGGAEPGGAGPGGAEPGGAETGGAPPGGVMLVLEVLRLQRVLLPSVPEVLVLWVLELLGLRVLLELVLLRVLALRLPLAVRLAVLLVVLLEVLELLEVLLEVLLERVLLLGVLVLSLLFLASPRGPDRTSFRSCSRFLVLLLLPGPQPVSSQSQLQPASPLPAPSPYAGLTGGLTERREPASRPASPVRTARTSGRGSRQRPPPVPGTHRMSLRPSTAPLRAPLPSPPASSLPALADPESDSLRAASPTVTRLLATAVTDPSFESSVASALVTELVDFAARCRLDYAASLVAESESACPPSVGGECALGTDILEDRQEEFQCLAAASPHLASVLLAPEGDPDALDIPTPRSYAEAIEGPYSSQWQAAMDAEMASWKSTGTYVDAVPPPGANIVSGM
ncbi:unnamed protein product [Closterium sp. NIES-65]|nr:unnamed protein product [Closterium sp. NIES-65]